MPFLKSLICAFIVICSLPAFAQTEEKTNSILKAWRDWAGKHNIDQTAITIGHNGTILASDGIGRDPNTAYPIASLSKAITAVCLHQIATEKNVDLHAPLGDLQAEFSKVNITIPDAIKDRTLASVITMSSGLKPDSTVGFFNNSYRYGDTRNIGFSLGALKAPNRKGSAGDFFYNNGNYALLGALLEALSGTDNVTACKDRVFPEGHRDTPKFDDEWIALAGFGGWEASTVDFTAFVMSVFGPESEVAQNIETLPKYRDLLDGWGYSLGTFFRTRTPQNIYWHKGALCGTTGGDQGAYFGYYPSGYAITMVYDVCGIDPLSNDLDNVLYNAAN